MAGKQAKLLTDKQIAVCLDYVEGQRHSDRNKVMLLLSVKAGMRAGEIAGLTWPMVSTAEGKISRTIELDNRIAKKGSGRTIPIHPDLRRALQTLRRQADADDRLVIRSERGGQMRAGAVVNWFANLYGGLGLNGCSSHSGRRTFITNAARRVHKVGGSLRDVQVLAGHRSITMTQRYIEGDTDAQRRLVNIL